MAKIHTILVTGANGFMGKQLVKSLLQEGHTVVAYDFTAFTDPVFQHPHCRTIQSDIRQVESVLTAAQNCTAIIHLAAAMGFTDYQSNYDINVLGTQHLITACQTHGISRIIAYSSVAATRKNPGHYGATKKQAEELLLAAQQNNFQQDSTQKATNVTIFRPTMILGYGGKGISTIVKQVKSYPFLIPLVGSGNAVRQPVAVDDMVQLTISALDNRRSFGKVYDVGGAERISFRDLVSRVQAELGVRKVFIPLPKACALGIARILAFASQKPEFTIENVRNVTLDECADIQPLREDLNFQPKLLNEILSVALRGYHGQ